MPLRKSFFLMGNIILNLRLFKFIYAHCFRNATRASKRDLFSL